MKFGIRKPSLKKSFKARTTGKLKRKVKKAFIPFYGKRGTGIWKNPRKAIYNRIYNRTTFSWSDLFKPRRSKKHTSSTKHGAQKKGRQVQKNIKFNNKVNDFSKKHPRFAYVSILVAMTFLWLVIIGIAASVGSFARQKNAAGLVFVALLLLFAMFIQKAMNESRKKYKGMTSQVSVVTIDPLDKEPESNLADFPAEEIPVKKPFKVTLKRVFIAILVITAFTALGQWGKPLVTEKQKADKPKAAQSEKKPAEETETDYISKFIDGYNASAQTPIEKDEQFDPHDSSGDHYRTEFRLSAFDGSVGLNATCGDLNVDIINYGSYGGFYEQNKSLRVYASGPEDQVVQFFRTAAPILDPKVSNEDVIKASTKDYGGYPGYINNSNLTVYTTGGKLAETMIDASEYTSQF